MQIVVQGTELFLGYSTLCGFFATSDIKMVYKLLLLSQLLLAVIVASDDEPTEVFGVVGKPLTLTCPLPVSEPPLLNWKDWVHTDNRRAAIIFTSHGNTNRVPNDRHSQAANYEIDEELRLTMKTFGSDDVGTYACESTVNKTKEVHKFTVSSVGDFKCDGKTTDVKEGEPLNLNCHATYRGKLPAIAWYMGETMTESDQNINFGTADYNVISAGQPEMDGAKFTCRMIYGEDAVEECDVTVTVEYTVRNLTFEPTKVEYHANEKVEVRAVGNPTPKIRCTMPDKTVILRDGLVEITIKEEWVGENKMIECTATNKVDDTAGTETKSIVFKTSEAKPEPEPASGSDDNKSMIIIICIVVAVVALIVIVVAVICVRRKKSQKRQRLPTKEEEVRRLEDGKA